MFIGNLKHIKVHKDSQKQNRSQFSPVENQYDLELDFKGFFFLLQGKWTTLNKISLSLKLLYGIPFSAFTQELKSALILSTYQPLPKSTKMGCHKVFTRVRNGA